MTYVNVLKRSEKRYYLVHDIEQYLIRARIRRAIAVRIHVCGKSIRKTDVYRLPLALICLGNFGIGVGHKLNVTEALHLGNHLETERAHVIYKFL